LTPPDRAALETSREIARSSSDIPDSMSGSLFRTRIDWKNRGCGNTPVSYLWLFIHTA
jgi:hypothetical protein